MIRLLIYYLINLFNSAQLSLENLVAYTTDHVQRLIARNGTGTFTEQITATVAALLALEDSSLDDNIQLGIRRGVKLAKDSFRAELSEAIRPIYGAVLAAFNEPSEEMRMVFPKGRSIFSRTRDDRIQTHLNTMVAGVTELAADLDPAIVTRATELRDQWVSIYTASEEATGVKTLTEEEQRNARSALAKQLYLNLAHIMTVIPDQPELLGRYMQQHLLDGRRTSTPPGTVGSTGSGSSSLSSSMATSSSIGSSSAISSSVGSSSSFVSSSSSSSSVSTAPSSSSAS